MGVTITLPATPKPAPTLEAFKQAVSVWTRQAEQAIRQVAASAGSGGGTTQVADSTHTGLLSASDWVTFNNKQPAGGYLTDAPSDGSYYTRKDGAWAVSPSGGLGDAPSDGSLYARKDGAWESFTLASYLTDAPSDGSTYGRLNGAWSALSFVAPNRSISVSAPLSGGGDLSADRAISITKADASHDGYLSKEDWATFSAAGAGGASVLETQIFS